MHAPGFETHLLIAGERRLCESIERGVGFSTYFQEEKKDWGKGKS